jgi:hypothetical protein
MRTSLYITACLWTCHGYEGTGNPCRLICTPYRTNRALNETVRALNETVSFNQIIRYIIANPTETVPLLNIEIGNMLTTEAKSTIRDTVAKYDNNSGLQVTDPMNENKKNRSLFKDKFKGRLGESVEHWDALHE